MGVLSFRSAEQQQPHVLPERRPFLQVHFTLFPIPTSNPVFTRIREAAPVIDQYQVSTDKRSGITSDPNRADDPEYIVRLVGQVIRVSVETVKIVSGLPAEFEPH